VRSKPPTGQCFVIAGVDENRRIQVRNVLRERLDGKEIVDTLSLQNVHQAVAIGVEESQISKAIGPFLVRTMILRTTLPQFTHLNTWDWTNWLEVGPFKPV
jgi:hypothetical protein